MAWQIKIHTLNVGQGDAQIIEVWDEVAENDTEYKKWKKEKEKVIANELNINVKEFTKENPKKYQAILIDGGPSTNVENIENYISDNSILITKVLLTHLDGDHYSGLFQLMINDYVEKNKSTIVECRTSLDENIIVKEGPKGVEKIYYKKTYLEKKNVGNAENYNKPLIKDFLTYQRFSKNETINEVNVNKLLENINLLEEIEKYNNLWIPIINKSDNEITKKINFKKNYEFTFSNGGSLEDKIKKDDDKKRALSILSGLTKITTPNCLNEDQLGDDILGFNEYKLLKQQDQEKVNNPGLYLVALNGDHYKFGSHKLTSTVTNASSIGLLLVAKDFTYLTCGDLEDNKGDNDDEIKNQDPKSAYNNWDLESLLANSLNAAGYNHIDFMKVGHHGSAASCSNFVLNKLMPKNVIISCGGQYDHGHPTREVIHRLNSKDFVTKIFLTNSAPRYGISKSWTNNIYKTNKFEKFENEKEYLKYINTLWAYKDKYESETDKDGKKLSKEEVQKRYEKKIDEERTKHNEKIFVDKLIKSIDNNKIENGQLKKLNEITKNIFEENSQLIRINCIKGNFEIPLDNKKYIVFNNKTTLLRNNNLYEKEISFEAIMSVLSNTTNGSKYISYQDTGNRNRSNVNLGKRSQTSYNSKYILAINNDLPQLIQKFLELIPHNNSVELQKIDDKSFSYVHAENKWIWIPNDFLLNFNILSLSGTYSGDEANDYYHSFYNATAKATILFRGVNSGVHIMLNLNTTNLIPYWEFSLASESSNTLANNSLSIKQLVTLADEDYMPYKIPDSLTDIFEHATEELTINRFDGSFYANPNFSSKLNIDVSLNKKWTLIEGKLSIENIGFDLELEPDSITGGIYGTLTIAEKDAEIYVGMDTESTWTLSINGKTNKDESNEALPNLVDVGKCFIDGFENVSIPFIAENDDSNSKLELTLIQMKVNFEATNKIKELAINSVITINNLKFNILLHIYPTWKIKGYLDTNQKTTFGDVLTNFTLGTIDSLKDIVISKASVEAFPESNFYAIEIALGNVSDFEIDGKKVELVETSLTIKSIDSNISGVFAAKLMVEESSNPKCGCNDTDYIEDTVFEIEAAYDNGWQFKGDLAGNISLELLTNWLKDTLEVSLPGWVQNLHLNHAAIAFSTDGNYSFDIALYSNLSDDEEDDKQKLEITLQINKEKEKEKDFKLSATVDIAHQSFKATINKSTENSKLTFEWTDKIVDSEITIDDILSSIGLQDTLQLPDGLDIGFNAASITFETSEENKCLTISASKQKEDTNEYGFTLVAQKKGKTWLYAFVVNIKKVNLHFNSLPLIGAELPENIGVNNISLMALSQDIKADSGSYLDFIPQIIKPTHEEDYLQKGGYLSMELDLGNGNKYPILVSTASKKQKTGEEEKSLQLYAGEPTKAEEKPSITWKKIAKKVGPLQFNKIGFSFQSSELNLYFDAALLAGPLMLGLDELQLASPITKIEPKASLNGLSLQYSSSAVQIGGSFKKDGEESYSGSALIGTKAFQLKAIGAYSKIENETSLFVYAMLNKDIGGPSQFYIKGIASGFGYNRNLLLPTLDDVQQYPFVAPFIKSGTSAKFKEDTTVSDATTILKNYVSSRIGDQWFVAGIKFSTYKILDSVALLALKFGAKTEIALIGFSEINYPKKSENPLIYAQLALVASILPDEGIAAVNAQLTAESYLFSKECKLTGGFAFYLWFGNNENSGDFVVTLGGYHPNFNVPSHYPQVPRLGFNWSITTELSIKGEMYFALTPKCIMAGGRFEANYQSGNFRAWFIMGANFIIAWKPYHYEANMYIVFGVSYQLKISLPFKTITKNISANFGAQLQVWGPDFSGTACIDLSVISFTINFGKAQRSNNQKIDWSEFKTSFLPAHSAQVSVKTANDEIIMTDTYCSSKAISGMKANDQKDIIQLAHENVVFEISTVIPSKTMNALSSENWQKKMGIKPAGITSNKFSSELKIEIKKDGKEINMNDRFIISEKLENIADALWGDGSTPDERLIKNALVGLYIEPKPKKKEIAVPYKYSNDKDGKLKISITTNNSEVNLNKGFDKNLFSNQGWL